MPIIYLTKVEAYGFSVLSTIVTIHNIIRLFIDYTNCNLLALNFFSLAIALTKRFFVLNEKNIRLFDFYSLYIH